MESRVVAAPPAASSRSWHNSWVLRKITELRIEEFIAYLFFIPCLAITIRANSYFWLQDYGLGRKIGGGVWRILLVSLILPLIPYLSRRSDRSRLFSIVRNALPFVICLAIYTNLHDTIHFVNPHDVQEWFLKADIRLFGVEPTIWAQQFYRPWLTEVLSFCYTAYLPLTVLLPLILYARGRDREARITLLGIVLCFYWGYVFYVAFPAVPPRLWIADQYTHNLEGGLLTSTQHAMVSISESSSRAAFPSLHAAITLLTLIYSFRYARRLLWLLLPLAVGLLTATVYLRHHYVVDLMAGIVLALASLRYSPSWERSWDALRNRIRRSLAPAAP